MSSWQDRYARGDCAQVWAEMLGTGAPLRSDPNGWAAARAVAALTMQPARENAERLIGVLRADGYLFDPGDGMVVFESPDPGIAGQLDELEAAMGTLQLSLRAWYEHVGRLSLIGRHPAWNYDYSDPLVVDAPVDYVLSEFGNWQTDRGTQYDQGEFTIDLSPDYLHKANVSGGAPYSMAVPNPAVDGLLLWERHQTTFVNYLRTCFAWAGLPGWDRGQHDRWAQPSEAVPAALAHWAAQLLPI